MNNTYVFKTIYTKKNQSDLIYIPSKKSIFNKYENSVVYQLKFYEVPKYYYFKLEFESNNYEKIYQTNSQTHKTTIIGSIYNLNLVINLQNIYRDFRIVNHDVLQQLSYYLTIIQIRQINTNKKYDIGEDQLFKILSETNPLYLIRWNQFLLHPQMAIDLRSHKIITGKQIDKKYFKHSGGILETRDMSKIIGVQKYFDSKNTLVIFPENLYQHVKKTWSNYTCISYQELTNSHNNEFGNLTKIKYNNIIIHECYMQYISLIKKLLRLFKYQLSVWIINRLPMKYYISTDENHHGGFTINNLSTVINIWADFDLNEKKHNKSELIRFLMNDLNKVYFIIGETNRKTQLFDRTILVPNDFEKSILDYFNMNYNNWLNKLTNDKNNIYSFTNKHQNYYILSKIYDCFVALSLSVINQNQFEQFFELQINKILTTNNTTINQLEKLLSNYKNVRKISHQRINEKPIVDFNKIIEKIETSKSKIERILFNYNRYHGKNFHQTFDHSNCPVCYEEETPMTKLVCGHSLCIDCMMNILPNTKTCPLCMERIAINKFAIIKETVQNHQSTLLEYLKNNFSDSDTLVLTDLDRVSQVLRFWNYHVWEIKDSFIVKKLDILQTVNKICIISSPFETIHKLNSTIIQMFVTMIKQINPNIIVSMIEIRN